MTDTEKTATADAATQPAEEGKGTKSVLPIAVEYEEKTDAEIEAIIEAALFVAGHPVKYEKLATVLGMLPGRVRKFVRAFAERYNAPEQNRGIELVVLEEQCQLCTKSSLSAYVKNALGMRRTAGGISKSALEVLAIIAYREPITKSDVEEERGSDCSYQITTLLERRLIMRKGRADLPGRPILYGVSPHFLRCFGISSLAELPKIDFGESPHAQVAILPDDIPLDADGNPIDEDALYDPAGLDLLEIAAREDGATPDTEMPAEPTDVADSAEPEDEFFEEDAFDSTGVDD